MCKQLAHPQLLPESGTAEIQTRDFLRRTSKAVTITPSGHTYFSDPVKKHRLTTMHTQKLDMPIWISTYYLS